MLWWHWLFFGLMMAGEEMMAPGGAETVQLRVAEQCMEKFGEQAKTSIPVVQPANAVDIVSMIELPMNLTGKKHETPPASK